VRRVAQSGGLQGEARTGNWPAHRVYSVTPALHTSMAVPWYGVLPINTCTDQRRRTYQHMLQVQQLLASSSKQKGMVQQTVEQAASRKSGATVGTLSAPRAPCIPGCRRRSWRRPPPRPWTGRSRTASAAGDRRWPGGAAAGCPAAEWQGCDSVSSRWFSMQTTSSGQEFR
jgi:hypothetical protein